MPILLEGRSPQRIEYGLSLPHSLLVTASLICAADRFEGLADWLRETRVRLPADLYGELCLMVGFAGRYERFTGELLAKLPADANTMAFDDLMAHLRAVPGVHYQIVALKALARGSTPPPAPNALLDLLEDPAAWATFLTEIGSEADPQAVAALIRDGQQLKDRLLAVLERFWFEAYAAEFEATRPLMERSVAYHRAQPYRATFREIFVSITGRLVPEGVASVLPEVSTVTFMPSCYVGPYVAYTRTADNLFLFYNCRTAPSATTAPDGASLYPPLKALADETRLQILALLQGRELYAQEIVEQLDISQPAVSRHLTLMTAAGVLKIRREGNAKYYSVDSDTLLRLAKALRALA